MKKIGLIMRKGYDIHNDHISAINRISNNIILFTNKLKDQEDFRFLKIYKIGEINEEETIRYTLDKAELENISFFVTFQETDILLTAKLNNLLNLNHIPLESAKISRDKSRQRKFLSANNIPSPDYWEINNFEDTSKIKNIKEKYPLIVKPTMAAGSEFVFLVKNDFELKESINRILDLSKDNIGYYYDSKPDSLILIEEFLDGDEVTVDGIVVNGDFHLGGIHNKNRMNGPYFEENEYTLPYIGDKLDKILDISKNICKKLNLLDSLFNVELRKDRNGEYKVVEFSVRISGGHVYRNIRDVHGIDLVSAHITSLMKEHNEVIKFFLRRYDYPKYTTCIKFIYHNGFLVKNSIGDANKFPEFEAYYPTASINKNVYSAPNGFDIVGLLSLKYPYSSENDVLKLKRKSIEIEEKLNIEIKNNELVK